MPVAVEDEPGGEADDAAGAELEEVALAGGQLLGGDQGGDAPAGPLRSSQTSPRGCAGPLSRR